MFARFRLPEQLLPDNGHHFTSQELQEFCAFCGIRQLFSAPNNQSMSREERFVRLFKDNLKACATKIRRLLCSEFCCQAAQQHVQLLH